MESLEGGIDGLKFDRLRVIQLHILMIALIGGIGFVLYLGINMLQSQRTEAALRDVVERRFPAIQTLRSVKDELRALRDELAAAIGLRSAFLIEESLERADGFAAQVARLRQLVPDDREPLQQVEQLLEGYLVQIRELAPMLAEQTEDYAQYSDQAMQANAAFDRLIAKLDDWLAIKQTDFENQLLQINSALRRTHQMALVAGVLLLVGLFVLALVVSGRVLRAIQSSDRLKETFLSTISHELRTPMNGVYGSIMLLRKSALDTEQQELVESARFASMEMIKSVDEILTFTDFMAGAPRVRYQAFSLDRFLALPLKVMQEECPRRGLQFRADVDRVAGLQVVSDEHKITHVVRHLLENALKFSRQGEVALEVWPQALPGRPGEIELLFRITDSGPGIRPDLIHEIFRPFHQLEQSFSRRFGGLGIGLAICKAIADVLAGELKFENRPQGAGTLVTFRIPCRISTDAEEPASRHDSSPAAEALAPPSSVDRAFPTAPARVASLERVAPPGANSGADAGHAKILIVEDNRVNQIVLQKMLQKLQLDCLVAENGAEALERLKDHTVSLILMDCQMPVMDGFEATRRIRAMDSPLSRLPIIAVSANALDNDRQRCQEVGMSEFIGKPIDPAQLQRVLGRFLDAQAIRPAPERAASTHPE